MLKLTFLAKSQELKKEQILSHLGELTGVTEENAKGPVEGLLLPGTTRKAFGEGGL